jgi:hypothetical protein
VVNHSRIKDVGQSPVQRSSSESFCTRTMLSLVFHRWSLGRAAEVIDTRKRELSSEEKQLPFSGRRSEKTHPLWHNSTPLS